MQSLKEKALDHGIQLTPYQLDLFGTYLDELWDWNRKVNLTGLSTRRRMVYELFLDSLIPAPFLPKEGRLLDVGTGAGFPGLPLKIYSPRLKTHLLEANSKKISFLKQIIRLLKLRDIEVIEGRMEKERHHLHPKGYHVVTARALAHLPQTLTWCAPFSNPNGSLVIYLGRGAEEDLKKNRGLIERHHLFLDKMIPYGLPGSKSKRYIALFKKGP